MSSSETDAAVRLRFLCLNLYCHYAPHCSSPHKRERVSRFFEQLAHSDVLLLQEMFVGHKIGEQLYGELLERARADGLTYRAHPRTPKLGQNSGLLVLSRYPIPRQAERDWGSIWELFPTKKGILSADVVCSSRFQLTVYTLHLSAHAAADRAAQLLELVDMVRQNRRQHAAGTFRHCPLYLVVAGDFNICPWTQPDEHRNLLDTMAGTLQLYDVFAELSAARSPTCEDGRRIDYFWTNIPESGVLARSNAFLATDSPAWPRISDHQALFVDVTIPNEPPPLDRHDDIDGFIAREFDMVNDQIN